MKDNESFNEAVVLLSGGMDSTTLLYYALKKHNKVIAVSFNYNQRHKKELESAKNICSLLNVEHIIINISIPRFSGSPLVDPTVLVPKQLNKQQKITVVPFRNTLFLVNACTVAKNNSFSVVYIGAVADDQSSYPDCRKSFFQAFQQMIESQGENIKIRYPFIDKTKKEIVMLGNELKVPWEKTWTCYEGLEYPCDECDACIERRTAFLQVGMIDPLLEMFKKDLT